MSIITQTRTAPSTLQWWQWGKLHGAVNLIALCIMLVAGVEVPPVVVAVLLHSTMDYTFQSSVVAMNKGNRGKELVIHSLANGLQGAIAGLYISPVMCLVGAAVCIVTHFGIDYTRKYGVKSVILSAALDQASHVLVYVALFS